MGGTKTTGAVTHMEVAKLSWVLQKVEMPAAIFAAPCPEAESPPMADCIAAKPVSIEPATNEAPLQVAPLK